MKVTVGMAAFVVGLIAIQWGAPNLVLVSAVVLLLAGGWLKVAGGRAAHGHAHAGNKPLSARHEAGHAAVGRRLGHVHSGRLNRDGSGEVQVTLRSSNPVHAIAFSAAGRIAAGTHRGSGWDKGEERALLRKEVPAKDRARVQREGERLARKIVGQEQARIRRDAEKLMRDGRL